MRGIENKHSTDIEVRPAFRGMADTNPRWSRRRFNVG
jgi:hypothetical protein